MPGPEMLAGDADDQAEIGADDLVLRFDRIAAEFFEQIQIAQRANCGSSFRRAFTNWNLWKLNFKNSARSRDPRQQRRAIQRLQIRRQIARHARLLAIFRCLKFILRNDLLDRGGGIGIVIQRVIDKFYLAAI